MAFSWEKSNSDRSVVTSIDNTLISKSGITKVGDAICREEWPKVAKLDGRPWSTVVAKENKDSTARQIPKQNFNVERTKTWRKNLDLLHDNAFCNNEDKGTLPADIVLVAYGIAKHVIFIKLSKFLEGKGLDVYAITIY